MVVDHVQVERISEVGEQVCFSDIFCHCAAYLLLVKDRQSKEQEENLFYDGGENHVWTCGLAEGLHLDKFECS